MRKNHIVVHHSSGGTSQKLVDNEYRQLNTHWLIVISLRNIDAAKAVSPAMRVFNHFRRSRLVGHRKADMKPLYRKSTRAWSTHCGRFCLSATHRHSILVWAAGKARPEAKEFTGAKPAAEYIKN